MDNDTKINEEHCLERKWILGHIDGKKIPKNNCSQDVYIKCLNKVGEIDSIKTLWSHFNYIDIKKLSIQSCLYLFEDGILPLWESEKNMNGCIYKSHITICNVDEIFLKLILMIAGETLYPYDNDNINHEGNINGIYIKKTTKTFEFQIWTGPNSYNLTEILSKLTDSEWKCINIF